ncbi:MAG TPA: SUMF1/EgtB/PvdO family nonheme iron enzyme [Polyangiaceae bacterium]|nr:SUMF1/EgtB/PvdO family nonheme iron enzyme [Polyangiaceae bacterium]
MACGARFRATVGAGLSSVAVLSLACSNLLGISEPFPRASGDGGSGTGAMGGLAEAGDEAGGTDGDGTDAAGASSAAGASGAPPAACPTEGDRQCAGPAGKTPQICRAGEWLANPAQNAGNDCPVLCRAGECQDCEEPATRCSGATQQRCQGGAWVDAQACASYCLGGECSTPPSCRALGNHPCAGQISCCRALEVPGGSFVRDYDAQEYDSKNYTATVSSFLMDKFEVTVGRLVGFVDAYTGPNREKGDGKSAHIANDPGWQVGYPLPADANALRAMLNCNETTWTDLENGDLNLPVNCLNFYVAYDFCIWDGGRLPTEAEWNAAAAGGSEQRVYPWSVPADIVIDAKHAYYGQPGGFPIAVGSKPLGDGRWGHSDLAGNVSEWTLDYYTQPYPSSTCNDCMNATASATRVLRGGAFTSNAESQKVSLRGSRDPAFGRQTVGFRCVRDIPTP